MLLALPALDIPASAPAAHHAADLSSTSSVSPHAQLEPTQSTEPASTALTVALLALVLTLPALLAHPARCSTTESATTSAPMS